MKTLNTYINEKLKLDAPSEKKYNYFPRTKKELAQIIKQLIKERGNKADLNDIDTSKITDMSNLFEQSKFDGDISGWNVSNVTNMTAMFVWSQFTGNNTDFSEWDVSNLQYMSWMFDESKFEGDLSCWTLDKEVAHTNVFYSCPIKDKTKRHPKYI